MSPLVREPQQQRSREKFARILATTARLLESVPYEQLSTKQIAAEAGLSVGALYRFFPDKEAVVVTLARSWLDGDLAVLADATSKDVVGRYADSGSSEGFLAHVVDAYADRFRLLPGYRQMWFHAPTFPSMEGEGREVDTRIAERLHEVLVESFDLPDTPESQRRVRLALQLGIRMLDLAFGETADGDPDILADTALMMDRYLFAPTRT